MHHFVRNQTLRFALLVCCFVVGATLSAQAQQQQQQPQQAFNKEEFRARRAKLVERLGADGVAVIFGAESHPHAVRFRQSPDFYYLTGIEEPGSVLIVNGARKTSFLFVPKRSPGKVAAEGPGVRDMEKPGEYYGINVLPLENFYSISNFALSLASKMYLQLTPPDELQLSRGEVLSHNAESMENSVFRHEPAINRLIGEIRKWKPSMQVADVSPLIDEMRWVKSPYEIERMRKAGQIVAEGVRESMKGTKPGMYEYEIEAVARFFNIKRGARGDAFMPIVASGPNTIVYHYTKNNRQMQAGEIVYFDYGTDYDYYTSDITRTWAVSGRFTPEQEKWYQCILEARNTIIAAMKPGVSVRDLQKAAEPVYQKYGFLQEYINGGRYVGHFVGLSVHDPGDQTKPFVPGVVFNVEPVIEPPGRRLHLRLEDTVLVTANGAENLTAAAPAELSEIYALANQTPFGTR
ncbi:MAG: Xaa-Pro peptidase family protein [Acidobacteriota bacterium]|nr:Xaa-Pro peptidase family protein [Acidobacteriota bacterium]